MIQKIFKSKTVESLFSSLQRAAALLGRLSPPIWLIPITLFAGLIIRGGWIEPDTYAFFNRVCLSGLEFNTPILSKFFYQQIQCNIIIWFVVHVLVITVSIGLIAIALKKFYGVPEKYVALAGLCIYFIDFITAFEDDHLAFALIFIVSWWYWKKPNIFRVIVLGLVAAFLTLFVWQGAFVIFGIVFLSSIHYFAGFIEVIGLFLMGQLRTDTGKSIEMTNGHGFFGNFIPYTMLFYYPEIKGFFWDKKKLIGPMFVFLALAFFQPKWGLYTLIPILPLTYQIFHQMPELLEKLTKIGLWVLIIVPALILITQPPQAEHWEVIKVAKSYQDQGEVVLNHWSLGRYFQYVGGIPSQAGGNAGDQNSFGKWYWLGPERIDCQTITSKDLIFFQSCFG